MRQETSKGSPKGVTANEADRLVFECSLLLEICQKEMVIPSIDTILWQAILIYPYLSSHLSSPRSFFSLLTKTPVRQ